MRAIVVASCLGLAIGAGVAGCSGKPGNTPLPTKEKTIDRAQDALQRADEAAQKEREAVDKATGS